MSFRIALLEKVEHAHSLPVGVEKLATLGTATLVGEASVPITHGHSVVLLGWAFRREGFGDVDALSAAEASRIVATNGTWALENLWGHYILIWAGRNGDAFLLRAPVAGPAIFHAPDVRAASPSRTSIAFTSLSLARSLGCRFAKPDPERVAAALRYPFLRGPATELEKVREILPGEIVGLKHGRREPNSWSPWDHSCSPPRRADAAELRDLVSATVGAWSRRFPRIQLEISGGLDSSIVATCLGEAGATWRGLTLATTEPDGDERPYARAVVRRLGAELAERWRPPPGDPLAAPAIDRVRPGGFGLLAPSDHLFLEAAREFDADAIFTGAGGDSVFGFITSTAPILDALRFAGPKKAWQAAGDLARLARDNRWRAVALAAKRMLINPPIWPVDESLLSRRFADARQDHPWMEGAARAAPGQRVYGLNLLLVQSFIDAYDRALSLPMITPLLAQPIVEWGLGLASWQWCEGGQDRALARRAFAADIPPEVLARRSKGRILSVFLPAFTENRDRLRPFLLEGWLSGHGLLELDAVEAMLKQGAGDPVSMMRVLHVADMERWARSIEAGAPGF